MAELPLDFSKPRALHYKLRTCLRCGPGEIAVSGYGNNTQWCINCDKILLKNGKIPFSFFDWFWSKKENKIVINCEEHFSPDVFKVNKKYYWKEDVYNAIKDFKDPVLYNNKNAKEYFKNIKSEIPRTETVQEFCKNLLKEKPNSTFII